MNGDLPPTQAMAPNALGVVLETTEFIPTHIGRFRIERILGRGGFGIVYLGYDEQLQRKVAIKVPQSQLVQRGVDCELYLKEARTVAGLEHPNVVPVHEVGTTPEFPIYIVSKYIEGRNLASQIKRSKPTQHQATLWMIDLADALREAHRKGFVHRDVKPQNVLVDQAERVYLVDFGLALADLDIGKRLPAGGTPAYMSPEQAKGEGHRVDGRSDIFSLGVMFYELLAGRRPFFGDTQLELFSQIIEQDPKPISQWDDTVNRELERICLKMLAKRKSERYSNAKELMDDLRAFIDSDVRDSQQPTSNKRLAQSLVDTQAKGSLNAPNSGAANSNSNSFLIVPKGLRSFDQHDADFFLELLPGPRDRNGIPDTVRFWKKKIEERDSDKTFAVGLIYGPSGCGKSSMIKAGLLPRLPSDILAIYLEASPDQTEWKLLSMLQKRLDEMHIMYDMSWTLVDLLSAIRRGNLLPANVKVILVVDQFEQWLYGHARSIGTQLLDALLQFDGTRLQAILMVRDDFWMAATRFFRDLDIPLVEHHNSGAIDLFDLDHAEKVLRAFGRAFGKLETKDDEETIHRKKFISESVRGLAENGKVISVRLSLFAEMMKGRPWTTESLRDVGGARGVGATFLEETFLAAGAPPHHRYHQDAACLVLSALLPEVGTNIKAFKRSAVELRAACKYDRRQRDFDDMIRILDAELRLITPVDVNESFILTSRIEGADAFQTPSMSAVKNQQHEHLPLVQYQLTHDYLVPSLRDWLTRKQRETRKGRAELTLAERAATWINKQENKQLPTLSEWFSIYTLTDSKRWTEPQRAIMRRSARLHGIRWGGILLSTLLISLGIQWWISSERWKSLRDQTQTSVEALQNNLGPSVPFNLEKLNTLPRELVLPELQLRFASTSNPRQKLSLAFALAHYGKLEADYLISRIDDIAEPDMLNFTKALRANAPVALRSILSEAALCVDRSLWHRKARLATIALDFGNASIASDMCTYENRIDPEQRTRFIDEFPRWEHDLTAIHDLVFKSDDSPLLSGLCLAIGSIDNNEKIANDKTRWQSFASRLMVESRDASMHSAAGWLLRRWGQPEPKARDQDKIVAQRDWFINSAGATMLRIRYSPTVDAYAPDSLEAFRNRLTYISSLDAADLDRSDIRKSRATSHYQVGNIQSALDDFDWLLEHNHDVSASDIALERIPALARLGRIDEANKSLAEFMRLDLPESHKAYLKIQLHAWTGDYAEAQKQLRLAEAASSKSLDDQYNLACAASICAKAAKRGNSKEAEHFNYLALHMLERLRLSGFSDKKRVREDPDFSNLYFDSRFASWRLETTSNSDTTEFWIADREVSRGQFELFMNDSAYPEKEKPEKWVGIDVSISPTVDHPAQNVCWYDSILFCNWLSSREGLVPSYERTGTREQDSTNGEFDAWRLIPGANGYRLLNSAEWSYACRAGTGTDYSSGNDESLVVGYAQISPSTLTAVCGQKMPNAWGLYDVDGNVSEWCEDRATTMNSLLPFRTYRGGSWIFPARFQKSESLFGNTPSLRNFNLGFRLAMSRPASRE